MTIEQQDPPSSSSGFARAGLMTFLGYIVRGIGQLLVIAFLGLSSSGDAYAIAVTVQASIAGLTLGAFNILLPQAYWSSRGRGGLGRDAAERQILGLALRTALIFLLLGAAVWFGSGVIGRMLLPGGTVRAQQLASAGISLVALSLPCLPLVGALSGHSVATDRYVLASALDMTAAVGTILGALAALSLLNHVNPALVIVGGRAIAYVAVALSAILVLRPAKMPEQPIYRDRERLRVADLSWPSATNAVSLVVPYIERALSSLLGSGIVALFYYAAQIISMLGGGTARVLSIVLGGKYARNVALGSKEAIVQLHLDIKRRVRSAIGIWAGMMVILIAVLMGASRLNLAIGEFGPSEISQLTILVAWYSPVACAMAVGSIVARAHYALARYKFTFLASVAGLGVYVALSLIFIVGWVRSIEVLALQAAIFWTVPTVILYLQFNPQPSGRHRVG